MIVDEAHGSHFKFNPIFPESALEQGADIVIQSHHKTLAVLGQGSVLHVKGKRVDVERLKFNIRILQTTSPSYPIMISIDKNRELLETKGERLFSDYTSNLTYLRNNLTKLVQNDDISKIVIKTDGLKLESFLREKYNIYIELACRSHAILLTSYADLREDYDALLKAMNDYEHGENSYICQTFSAMPEMKYRPNECMSMTCENINIRQALGRVSADFITSYPPGIPIIGIGEVFSAEIIHSLPKCQHVKVFK